jgi:hypothetical protein
MNPLRAETGNQNNAPSSAQNGTTSPAQKGTPSQHLAEVNLANIFDSLTLFSPYFVVFLILFNSIINNNLKGLIYLCGLILLLFVVIVFQKMNKTSVHNPDPMCNLFKISQTLSTIPSFTIALIGYSITYLLFPMINNGIVNYPLIIILFFIFFTNMYYRVKHNCTTMSGIIYGALLGCLWGMAWYFAISSKNATLTYYDDFISNKVACSRPTKQTFKCSVYKNGELLQTI